MTLEASKSVIEMFAGGKKLHTEKNTEEKEKTLNYGVYTIDKWCLNNQME